MSYDWNKPADETQKMEPGIQLAKISSVITGKKTDNGMEAMRDKNDNRFVVVVMESMDDGGEATYTCWVEGNMDSTLRRLVQVLEIQSKLEGEHPTAFLNRNFAEDLLVGTKLFVQCEHKGKYANAYPMQKGDVPAQLLNKYRKPKDEQPEERADVAEDDIPF